MTNDSKRSLLNPATPPANASPPRGTALFALGFRPFFLLAGLLAVLYVPLWILVYYGKLALPIRVYGPYWHGHEMIFGFAIAVIAGFLLTAVRNWTNRPTPSGASLGALALLWLLGRAFIAFGARLPSVVVAAVDIAFLPAVAAAIAIPIVRARNWRNLAFAPLLLLLAACNVLFYSTPVWTARSLRLSIDLALVIVGIVGGRVIPLFTASALKAEQRKRGWIDWAAIGSLFVLTGLDAWPAPKAVYGVVAMLAGAIQLARMIGWHTLRTRRQPILWVLHVGYAWLGVGLLLTGLVAFVPRWSQTAPLHALAVGCIATLILGMASRVSLGHTGRPLTVTMPIVIAYGLVTVAAILRSFGAMVAPGLIRWMLMVAATAWSLSFAIFTLAYAPVLVRPRIDGKPG